MMDYENDFTVEVEEKESVSALKAAGKFLTVLGKALAVGATTIAVHMAIDELLEDLND